MNFDLNDVQLTIRDAIRDLAEKEFEPRAKAYDESGEFPHDNIQALARYGYLGMTLPEEIGAAGADWVSYAICVEEVSRACAATGVIFEVLNSLFMDAIWKFGTDEQKQRILPDCISGERLGAFALTEPQAGSDAAAIETTAEKEGDRYVLNGRKCFITNAGVADCYIVFASSDREQGARGLTAFVVDKDMPGVSFGEPEDKLGIRASQTADVVLEDCEVPEENRLGGEGEGFKIAMATLDGGRIGIGCQAVGIAQRALDLSVAYSKEREQFGRPIAKLQAIQWMLADMKTEIDASRLLVNRAAYLHGKGERATSEIAMAKLFASRTAMDVTSKAIQIHGGYGYMKDYTVERLLRDAKITEIYEGTSEVMRMVISASLLK